jgi:hypothetical protein
MGDLSYWNNEESIREEYLSLRRLREAIILRGYSNKDW